MIPTPRPRLNPQLTLRWIDSEDLRSQQWGLITSGQCRRLEMTLTDLKRLRQNGYLVSVAHGVMREPDRVGDGVLQATQLAWVAAGKDLFPTERLAAGWPDYVVTGTTALAIHGLGEPVGALPQLAVIKTQSARYQTSTADFIAHEVALTWNDVTLLDGLPVATPAVAIAALAAAEPAQGTDFATYLEAVAVAAENHPDRDQITHAIATATAL